VPDPDLAFGNQKAFCTPSLGAQSKGYEKPLNQGARSFALECLLNFSFDAQGDF
jgi:hypothetical protein